MGITSPLSNFFYNLYTNSIDFLCMILVEAALLVLSVICLVIKNIGFCSNLPTHRRWDVFMNLLAQRCPATRYMSGPPGAEPAECPVCLCEFEGGEEVRELQCKHVFHTGCLDKWLRPPECTSCPLCRRPVLGEEHMMMQRQAEWEHCEPEENWSHVLFNFLLVFLEFLLDTSISPVHSTSL